MDSEIVERVQSVFGRQGIMKMLCATLESVEQGEVEIRLPFRSDLTQHHGCLHAGVLSTVIDTACGLAALTLMPLTSEVLSVEFKINFLASTKRDVLARGSVVKPGRTITVCTGEIVEATSDERVIVRMQATMIAIHDRSDH